MDKLWIAIILCLCVLILVYIAITYNALVKRKIMVENQESQIDVELKRRFDLIPNLVEVVKGYATYEKDTLEAVINARNMYSSSNTTQRALEADVSLNASLTKLFALVESYPELNANTNFLNLQSELTNTEKKIAFSRQFYNDSVFKLNTKIEKFPSNFIAALFKFKKSAFFEISGDQRENIHIDF